ncbi:MULTISPECIES: saccharopine dehydrogenase family protein [unclassified Tolypothrix]|uniref:saccharopine dehydrogenase family protein n=1 Tax=unclassified Tolypothrix TaxID=2649714 RepID=UPI0005EABFAC|nr:MULTISPECIES: saccharopine dehydrogenase NADP-binding domain-containing protein [unclassified Tolypothrix]BAY89103.1 saccharopine dehydrogenase [Microchaete diplosiphon NIES-3275]EKF06267.1 saccharopine dehydrogenase [Tolypothrix sp. PCC 7601]MBE9087481.1 saccharopine dehydrogenase NADP-binding domain-containing protein [Tolypothrix sp. LEGE 11397]UYD29724.1 saccharopine dehydrogenase NADP-binding domain-containing protein [Tolypothrix sp. PCC 7712]UYD34359.1 saccharopine dehydrogenase NADP
MTNRVLILGGRGRIGSSVAQDIATHTQAKITITGRSPGNEGDVDARWLTTKQDWNLGTEVEFLVLDLAEVDRLQEAIANSDLVIHCAGPFHYRDTQVLEICIEKGVNYLDVSDHRSYTSKALNLDKQAAAANVTAIINTGIFPGISNSMVRQCVEQLDQPEKIHLSYLVSGSGGAGITVMRTTFLGLQHQFEAWIDGNWQLVKPYSERETVNFASPYGRTGVYWFDMPETFTMPHSFPSVKTVITKFGSVPDFYNHMTWITAHIFPKWLMQRRAMIEFLSHVSHFMTDVTNPFTGIGVAVRAEVTGQKDGKTAVYFADLVHENTALASGCGTGSIAQLLLEGKLKKPGVSPVEEALPTDLFLEIMKSRGIEIYCNW